MRVKFLWFKLKVQMDLIYTRHRAVRQSSITMIQTINQHNEIKFIATLGILADDDVNNSKWHGIAREENFEKLLTFFVNLFHSSPSFVREFYVTLSLN